MTVNALDDGLIGRPHPLRTPRIIVGYVAVISMLPYAILKVMWLFGSSIGVSDRSLLDDPTLATANWVTFGMEVIAAVAALALTHRWGSRLPAWLVLFPIWVAAGLLVPRVLTMPFYQLAQSTADTDGPQILATWVYVMVSCSFAVQGAAVLTAFVLYCRQRWGRILMQSTHQQRSGPARPFQVVVVRACCGFAVLIVALSGVGTLLAPGDDRSIYMMVSANNAVWMVLALTGALILVREVGARMRLWMPLCMVLVGSGAMVWWGVWNQIMELAPSTLTDTNQPPLVGIASLGGLCIGLVLALTVSLTVAERSTSGCDSPS